MLLGKNNQYNTFITHNIRSYQLSQNEEQMHEFDERQLKPVSLKKFIIMSFIYVIHRKQSVLQNVVMQTQIRTTWLKEDCPNQHTGILSLKKYYHQLKWLRCFKPLKALVLNEESNPIFKTASYKILINSLIQLTP